MLDIAGLAIDFSLHIVWHHLWTTLNDFHSLVEDLLSKVKAKFNIVEDEESNCLQIYERELSVTQQVDSIKYSNTGGPRYVR